MDVIIILINLKKLMENLSKKNYFFFIELNIFNFRIQKPIKQHPKYSIKETNIELGYCNT